MLVMDVRVVQIFNQDFNEVGPVISIAPRRLRDLSGRLKVSQHQNLYAADFEYGTQPLRWEGLTAGGGTITAQPGSGGVRMRLTTAAGDVTIRQSRPYHRYQPGKTLSMASAVNFGTASAGQVQRVGFFDDGNGIFWEQATPTTANPYGMFAVYRSDVNGVPVDTRIALDQFTDADQAAKINWSNIQMIFIEYAWYGAGGLRWGVIVNGEPRILHETGIGNSGAQLPWARTGNLPVRYEQRNLTTQAVGNDMYHWGVSVLSDGGIDVQRGFTYGYGMAPGTPRRNVSAGVARFPLLSFRYRPMGTQEYTQATTACTAGTTTSLTAAGAGWTTDQWKGRYVNYTVSGSSYMARIVSNTASVLTLVDNVIGGALGTAPVAGQNYTIGVINRGQLLPQILNIASDVTVQVELLASTPSSPIVLNGTASFAALSSLGSAQSFAERDVTATSIVSGGEVVYNTPSPSGGLNTFDLSQFFPLYNTIRGNVPDILTVAITTEPTTGAAKVAASIICQEAMS